MRVLRSPYLIRIVISILLSILCCPYSYSQGKLNKKGKEDAIISLIEKADSCLRARDYNQAYLFGEDALTLIKKPKKYRELYELARYIQAESLIRQGLYNDGITALKELNKRGLVVMGESSICCLLGEAYLYSGNPAEAVYYLEKSESLYTANNQKDDYYWRMIESSLAVAYSRNKQDDQAEEIVNKIIVYCKTNSNDQGSISILSYLYNEFLRDESGQFIKHDKSAILILQELINYCEINERWEWYVNFQYNLSYAYQVLGDYSNAQIHFHDAITHYQDSFTIPLATLYLGEATALSRLNNYEQAHSLLDKAEEFACEEIDGLEESVRERLKLEILEKRAILYLDQDYNIEKAINILNDLVKNDELSALQRSSDYYNLGIAYQGLFQYDKAYDCFMASLELAEVAEGHGVVYAKTINRLGQLSYDKGDYVASSEFYNLAISIFRRVSNRLSDTYIYTLGNASRCASEMHEYGRAIAYGEESRNIQLLNNNIIDPLIWDLLENCYLALGDKENYSLVNSEKRLFYKGDPFNETIFALNDVQECIDEGEIEKADSLFSITINNLPLIKDTSPNDYDYLSEFVVKIGNKLKPQSYSSFNFLTELLSKGNSYTKQEMLTLARCGMDATDDHDYFLANQLFKASYSTWVDNPLLLRLCLYYGYYSSYKCDDIAFCRTIASEIEKYIQEQMRIVIGLPDAEKERYWSYILDLKNVLFANTTEDIDNKLLYNVTLNSKSFLLRSRIVLSRLVAEDGGLVTQHLIEELHATKNLINNRHTFYSPDQLDSLRLREICLQRDIISQIRNYSNNKNLSVSNVYEVLAALDDNEVAIEIDDYPLENNDRQYIAFILNKTSQNPVMIKLCKDSDLLGVSSIGAKKLYDPDLPFSLELYHLFWEPLQRYFQKGNRIYISTSGRLGTIAFEAITTPSGTIIGDEYRIVRVSTTAEVCNKRETGSIKTASVFGGIRYDNKFVVKEQEYDWIEDNNGYMVDRSINELINYLPGTRKEAENVSKILSSNGISTYSLYGYEATETSFKRQSGSDYSLIHIATHGFYKPYESTKRIGFFQNDTEWITTFPMQRSGLFMANCNDAWNGLKNGNGEDGVLTASEISEMDLSSTQLVVLSACETGLGQVTEDGIAGLQRAFKNAGVQSLIMSLWKVDDKATELLMTEFYKSVTEGQSFYDALLLAKLKLKKSKAYNNPYYWAGFILLD